MKKLLLFATLLLALACENGQTLRIGTYNLRMAPLDKNTPNAWELRQPRLIESFLKEDMDICAVEEIDGAEQISIPALLKQRGLEYDSYFFCPYRRC